MNVLTVEIEIYIRESSKPFDWLNDRIFYFLAFFRKFLTNRPLAERIQKMDPSSAPPMLAPSSAPSSMAPSPWARANLHGRKLGASHSGAELGAELGARVIGAELPSM